MATYAGNWVDNKRHGFGRMVWADGRVYEGLWDNERRVSDNAERHWDRFFLKSIPEQRAFMKDFIKKNPQLSPAVPKRMGPASISSPAAERRVAVM